MSRFSLQWTCVKCHIANQKLTNSPNFLFCQHRSRTGQGRNGCPLFHRSKPPNQTISTWPSRSCHWPWVSSPVARDVSLKVQTSLVPCPDRGMSRSSNNPETCSLDCWFLVWCMIRCALLCIVCIVQQLWGLGKIRQEYQWTDNRHRPQMQNSRIGR